MKRWHRLLRHGTALALGTGIAMAVGEATRPFLGHPGFLILAVGLGSGTASALAARVDGRRRPLLQGLYAALGGSLGTWLGARLFG